MGCLYLVFLKGKIQLLHRLKRLRFRSIDFEIAIDIEVFIIGDSKFRIFVPN